MSDPKKNKTKTCPRCGGYGGCDASTFGDRGWHPCFLCGTEGVVPADYCEHANAQPASGTGVNGWCWNCNGLDILWTCPDCKAEFQAEPPQRLSQVCWE